MAPSRSAMALLLGCKEVVAAAAARGAGEALKRTGGVWQGEDAMVGWV